MTNKYHSFTQHGQLHIVNKTGSVSWKLYANFGGQHISLMRDGRTGAQIRLEEFYTSNDKDVNKTTYMHLELEQIDQIIAKLQDIKAECAAIAQEVK
jgi:hypothetical protein